ncbi:MAG: multifunctional CCA tRNA nucleotidyl transferase/2'3'-cyclic phosphodiesterase/2'nucleotidase/phosphatase [Betaproteobacteria bacterium]|jgi:tRNA nucleotidyltransferase (CCA-adding enzyme)|nr:multifunctional CCA tRNA nucleotidyl transferase/2'3'-cyclic phosphodiesterase/2'nucleotidase/phosphatase [Betaproteobacteria bacterium]
MKIYVVGGAVRDELLGLPVQDRDHVVVGATPEEMIRRGFRPVGRDFPVFLHPETHEEYALARTERKTAPGYHGFAFHAAPDVTLEQDLERRDLTINAMARDDDGRLIDPHHGAEDLGEGLLRHVSPAFAEDPVRILRVARFAARFGFSVAPETQALMRQMVEAGEADALVAERVWQELVKGLMERTPSTMFAVLRDCGALGRVLPQMDALYEDDAMQQALAALDAVAATQQATLEVRVAVLLRALEPEAIEALATRLRLPAGCRDLALLAARHAHALADADGLDADELSALMEAADAWRRPERFRELVEAALAGERDVQRARTRLRRAHEAALAVDAGAVAKAQADAAAIKAAVARARLAAIAGAIK